MCERERERVCVDVRVCVCERERERESLTNFFDDEGETLHAHKLKNVRTFEDEIQHFRNSSFSFRPLPD